MKKEITIPVEIEITWHEEDRNARMQAEAMSILIQKKLYERKYHDKLQEIINEARIEIVTELPAKTNLRGTK